MFFVAIMLQYYTYYCCICFICCVLMYPLPMQAHTAAVKAVACDVVASMVMVSNSRSSMSSCRHTATNGAAVFVRVRLLLWAYPREHNELEDDSNPHFL